MNLEEICNIDKRCTICRNKPESSFIVQCINNFHSVIGGDSYMDRFTIRMI